MKLKPKSKILVVDADTLAFRASKILQEDFIEVEYNNNGRKKVFKNLTEFKGRKKTKVEGWLGDLNKDREEPFLLQDFDIEPKSKIVHPDIVAHKALKQRISDLSSLPWVKDIKLLLGGYNGNFRDELFCGYKKGRAQKPLRFQEIKKWFVTKYEDIIKLSDFSEADDDLSIIGWWGWNLQQQGKENPIVMSHIDKDCDQIPGIHYNYDKGKFYTIDEFKAHYNLAIQCIVGDNCDSIESVPEANRCVQDRYAIGVGGIGPVKAKKILAGCKTIEDLYREIEELYICYYKEDYKKPLNLTYKLVHLMEKKGEIKDFPFTK